MSRFNALYLGEPGVAINLLEHGEGDHLQEVSFDDLRLALINALRRIERAAADNHRLQERVAALEINRSMTRQPKEHSR
jgi:hypothetical protein